MRIKSIINIRLSTIHYLFPVILFIPLSFVKAQPLTGLNPELQWRYIQQAYHTPGLHTMIGPWAVADIDTGFVHPGDTKGIRYFVHPLVNVQLSAGSSFRQSYEAGIHAGLSLGKSLSFDVNYSLYGRQFFPDGQVYIDSTGLIPHYGKYWSNHKDFYLYQSLNFNLLWTPNEYITVRAGKDRHFWGDGYRSLFLSDNAQSYPFLQTIFKVWNIEYVFMTTRMSDYQLSEHFGIRYKKYASMHALSWNITPSVNINLFEAVVWDAVDSVSQRTFDINYINPVILFRPVEFSIGSPDNVLLGIGGKFRIWRDIFLYGQFVLDEFKLDELTAGTGWWANKYAFQAGLRSFFGERRPVMLQVEFNQVRPFTYSHYYPLQNYGHLADCLAHPYGANLREGLVIARWAPATDWSLHARVTYCIQGTDSTGANFGGNIYKSNLTHGAEYGHTTLQGVRTVISSQELKIARMLIPQWNLQAEAILSNRLYKREGKHRNDFYFSIGLKTLLYRDY